MLSGQPKPNFSDADPQAMDIPSIIAHLEELPIGCSFQFLCKQKSLTEDWVQANAVKDDGFFVVTIDSSDKDPMFVAFDDETSSIMSANLWKSGWFAAAAPFGVSADVSENCSPPSTYIFAGKKNKI